MDQGVPELVAEDLGVLFGGKVALLPAGLLVLADDPVHKLLEAPPALRRADRAAEVLGGHDVGGVHRPEVGELDAMLLEVDRAVPPVRHDDIPAFPGDLVVGVHARRGVDAPDLEPAATAPRVLLPLPPAGRRSAHLLRHFSPFRDPAGSPPGPAWPRCNNDNSGTALKTLVGCPPRCARWCPPSCPPWSAPRLAPCFGRRHGAPGARR